MTPPDSPWSGRPSATNTQAPGRPVIIDGQLVSTNPASGVEVGRFAVADETAVAEAVARARAAGAWWAGLGFAERRIRLMRWAGVIVDRAEELADLIYREGGKPRSDGIAEGYAAAHHAGWAARHARRVLGPRRVRSNAILIEHASLLEYKPYGVVGVIGPWNYPIFTPMGSIGYALAAGNAVVFKPSEYTAAVGQWIVDAFATVVPEQPVLQAVHGLGDTGAALCRSEVDKVAFTGSTATGRKVMAACAERLTPVLIECGGKDAAIIDADADLDLAVDACVWGGMSNAGQSCVGIERVYAVDSVYDAFLAKAVSRASELTVGPEPDAQIGPITMPGQIDVIRRHIDDALARGGRAVLGGADAVQPPFVHPTILVEVPEDSSAVREETFGPTLTVAKVSSVDEAVRLANAAPYGLGAAVFGKRHALRVARALRSGMASINSTFAFGPMSTLPFGGVGWSGFGRIHGEDGLREFAQAKAITRRRGPSLFPALSFRRSPRDLKVLRLAVRLLDTRRR